MGRVKVPELETDRLILRMWNRRDAGEFYDYAKNPSVGPNAGWRPHSSPAESRAIICRLFLKNTSWAVTLRDTGRVVGSIGLEEDSCRDGVDCRELGYSLAEDQWGKGLMTEAAKRVIGYGFEDMKLEMITIKAGSCNVRSMRVIEKCGFVYEGTLRRAHRMYNGATRDIRCYSLMKEEYKG